jgi:hypothetical protein
MHGEGKKRFSRLCILPLYVITLATIGYGDIYSGLCILPPCPMYGDKGLGDRGLFSPPYNPVKNPSTAWRMSWLCCCASTSFGVMRVRDAPGMACASVSP